MLKSIVFATLSVPALLAASFSQSQQQHPDVMPALSSDAATDVCQSTFTTGAGPTYLQFCVTQNGNITEFQSPVGVEHIREGSYNEGYGICDFSSLNRYYDWADGGDSGNWLAPVRTQPKGPNTFPLKIVRTTSDGIFTLTQVFSETANEQIAKITMTIKNDTAVSRDYAVVRYADIDANNADGGDFKNWFDFEHQSGWGYNPGFNTHGLMLYSSPTSQGHFGFVQNTPDPPDPCSPVANLPSITPWFGDGSAGHDWNGTLGPGKSATFTAEYKRF
jgi:hypothetical protein